MAPAWQVDPATNLTAGAAVTDPHPRDHIEIHQRVAAAEDNIAASADATTGAASPAQKAAGFLLTRRPYQIAGLAANGATDDAAVLQAALNAMAPYDTAVLPPGATVRHVAALTMTVPNVTLRGAPGSVLTGPAATAGLKVQANGVTLEDVHHVLTGATTRDGLDFTHAPFLIGKGDDVGATDNSVTDVTLRRCTGSGSQSATFFYYNVKRIREEDCVARDGLADGHHFTGGCQFGTIVRPVAINCGDDGVAVVSYLSNPEQCTDFAIYSPRVMGGAHGRGVALVGAKTVRVTDVWTEGVGAAALYVAIENGGASGSNSWATSDVRISGGTLYRSNYPAAAADNGAILLLTSNGLALDSVTVEDIRVVDSNPARGAVGAKQHSATAGTMTNCVVTCTLEGDYSEDFAVNNVVGAGVTLNVTLLGHRSKVGTAAPTTGFHYRGERVDNPAGTSGQPSFWVCTTAGTPGTWKAGPAFP